MEALHTAHYIASDSAKDLLRVIVAFEEIAEVYPIVHGDDYAAKGLGVEPGIEPALHWLSMIPSVQLDNSGIQRKAVDHYAQLLPDEPIPFRLAAWIRKDWFGFGYTNRVSGLPSCRTK